MQACIVIGGKNKDDQGILAVAKALSKGLESQGHSVDIINAYIDNDKKLTFYDYVIVGSSATTAFGGSIPDVISTFLKRCGQVSGKRCLAFVTKGGLRSQKTLSSLMKIMEQEGMYLKYSEVFKNEASALALGKRLNIERNF
ncbi:hypothetical protein [Bullifex porci]|uniref:flavodoxin family protein n=1 Tax=Bullifex porci TaxID=2606638 RepID=UPI0019D1C629|nr:hypothetical protein [Bullifex porci]MDD7254929.1 hypothetical protein [Bullifex porci]MDD7588208.1 hypothetical protein [Bullifex porci]MDY2741614.1 hypothetical protein [Bullifex porci]